MFEGFALMPFPLVIVAYLRFIYRAEADFRRAVERALIRNREVRNAYANGYVAGFEIGKCGGGGGGRRIEDTGALLKPGSAITVSVGREPVRNPVELKFWGRDSAVTVSRPDIFHIEQETHLSPMMVYLTSRGTERPFACEPCESLRKINHTLRLDRWIEAQRPGCEERTWRRAQ